MSLRLDISKTRPQLIVLILEALERLGASGSRQEVIRLISIEGWFAHEYPIDNEPYPSQKRQGRNEPRWETLVAFARKDAVDGSYAGLLDGSEWDCWRLTRPGREALVELKDALGTKRADARIGYMWSKQFKTLIDSNYVSGNDSPRPPNIYSEMESALNAARRLLGL